MLGEENVSTGYLYWIHWNHPPPHRTCYVWGGFVNLFIHVTAILEIDRLISTADWLITVTW